MFLLTYSQDILYLVLAFCVLWITVFLAWFIYYLIVTIRQFHKISQSVKKQVDQVEATITSLRQKINRSASYLSLIVDGIKKIVALTKKKQKKNRTAKETKVGQSNV